jgi:hypothetical protein
MSVCRIVSQLRFRHVGSMNFPCLAFALSRRTRLPGTEVRLCKLKQLSRVPFLIVDLKGIGKAAPWLLTSHSLSPEIT